MRAVAIVAVILAVISIAIFVIVLLTRGESKKDTVVPDLDGPGAACQVSGHCETDADCPGGFQCRCHIECSKGMNTCETPACPMDMRKCLPPTARIDTPRGEVAIDQLRVGDVVWTITADGARVAAPLVEVTHLPVEPHHEMTRLSLDTGQTVVVSPEHPTCFAGPTVGSVGVGDAVSLGHVESTARVPYAGSETFDILPAGATGCYWADGVMLGSTLYRQP